MQPAVVRVPPAGEPASDPDTDSRTGKFCRAFAPVSPSPSSFGVAPIVAEVDPAAGVIANRLPRIALPMRLSIKTPPAPAAPL